MKARFLALAALVLGLASCQNDPEIVNPVVDGEVDFQLAVGVPELGTRANDGDDQYGYNSAYGAIDYLNINADPLRTDWTEVDLRYSLEVYDVADNYADAVPVKDRQVIIKDSYEPVAFNLRLVPGRNYHFVVFADFVEEDATDNAAITAQANIGKHHVIGNTLGDITIKNDGINDECTDAYFATKDITISNSAAQDIELKRPYGKLRVIATDLAELNINVDPAAVVVTYDAFHPNAFNAVTGAIDGEYETKEYVSVYNDGVCKLVDSNNTGLANHFYTEDYDNKKTTNKDGVLRHTHMTLFTDYILANDQQEPIHFSMKVFDKNDELIKETHFNTEIPIQRNFLTTIVGNVLTTATEINVTIDDNFDGENSVHHDPNNAEEALKQNHKNIYVELADDVALNGNGVKWGGEDTELIVIDGKKLSTFAATGASTGNHTLTFNTTYRLHIETVNPDAKVILRNLNVTTNKESGTWDIYDIQFNCNVEIENVNFQKAIAFVKDGQSVSIKNVTINETHDYYAMWISAVGQTVNIDNLVVNSEGRGIKIDEEYVDAPAKVTLNINNAKFTTAKKAAIMVKSVAGADITLSNVDITDVAADREFAVWVDEDSKAYANMVSVTGAYVKVENAESIVVSTQDDLKSALESGKDVVAVANGEYSFPASSIKAGQTVVCAEGTVFTGKSNLNINGATVIGATFQSGSNDLVAYYSTINGTYKNCVFNGDLKFSEAGDTVVFENCVFNGPDYALHFDTAVANSHVILKGCEVNSEWRVAIGAAVSMFEAIDTKFNVAGFINLWGKAKFTNCAFNKPYYWICCMDTTEFTNCTCEDRALVANDIRIEETVITIDGVTYEIVADGVMKVNGDYEISSKAGMFWFANEVNANGNAFAGKTVKLAANIDLNNDAWTPVGQTGATTFNGVFDGQEFTISNLNVDSEAQTGANYSSGLFGWVESHTAGHGHIKNVKINGATIAGHHNCGALVGYITQETALVENCHVTGATVTCTKANNDADGDKAGALIGNATVATPVKNCTAANSTVYAGRDAGQVIGAGREANVTGCSVTNVTVSANGTSTGANVRNEVIGRLL